MGWIISGCVKSIHMTSALAKYWIHHFYRAYPDPIGYSLRAKTILRIKLLLLNIGHCRLVIIKRLHTAIILD